MVINKEKSIKNNRYKNIKKELVIYAKAGVCLAATGLIFLYGSESLASNEFDGAKAQAALKAVQGEIGHIAKLISYGIGASGGIAAAFFILAKQNLGAGAIATTAAVAGIALPSMFASGALI
jgi:hypothetical protein